VHQARAEPLEQLALPEHDLGLVARAPRQIAGPVDRLAEPDQVDEQLRAAREQDPADAQRRGERQRSDDDVYGPRVLLSSAVIAGTISVRSPITA
jgi:hypothetical protein